MGGLSKPKLASSQDSLSLFKNQSICGSQFIATIESSLSLSFRFVPLFPFSSFFKTRRNMWEIRFLGGQGAD
jgi:hypothetical protein